jgi:hypothetical protein
MVDQGLDNHLDGSLSPLIKSQDEYLGYDYHRCNDFLHRTGDLARIL